MAREPIEFAYQDRGTRTSLPVNHRFRMTPLGALSFTREVSKLLTRVDHDSGVLDTLSFNFGSEEYAEIAEGGTAGIIKIVKMCSMLLGTDELTPRSGVEPVEDDDEGDSPPKPADSLPRTLEGLCLYYAELGQVEEYVDMGEGREGRWAPLRTAEEFEAHPFVLSLMFVTYHVLRVAIAVPFFEPLRALSEERRGRTTSATTSKIEEATTLDPPTSTS